MGLKVSSKLIPYSTALRFDFAKNQYVEAYNTLFQGIREWPNNISYTDYSQGYTIFAFDLSPDLCSDDHFSLLKDGSLDLEFTFATAPADNITAVFYLEFDNKSRNVLFDYQV